jgi:DNA-binding LacI/PurR family transcriptional regulator
VLGLYVVDMLSDSDDEPSWWPRQAGVDNEGSGFRMFPIYVDEVQRGFQLECQAQGYAMMVGAVSRHRREALTDIAGRVDAAAVVTRVATDEELAVLSQRLPLVLVSQGPRGGYDRVSGDNYGGMLALSRHLAVDHGFTDPLFVGDPRYHELGQRHEGFLAGFGATLTEPRREPVPFLVKSPPRGRDLDLRTYLADHGLPDVFVCGTDQSALSLLEDLAALGIEVPTDTAVTGYDGTVAGMLSVPPLTTVRQPLEQLGCEAARMLVDRLAHSETPQVTRQLDVQTRIRQSCGCPPPA